MSGNGLKPETAPRVEATVAIPVTIIREHPEAALLTLRQGCDSIERQLYAELRKGAPLWPITDDGEVPRSRPATLRAILAVLTLLDWVLVEDRPEAPPDDAPTWLIVAEHEVHGRLEVRGFCQVSTFGALHQEITRAGASLITLARN